jgi:NAD(P)-dependent dehydrogenase (short-subunit alcohol dehydrogenase family)
VVAGHDLSGLTAIVTGAASGIGVETARALVAGSQASGRASGVVSLSSIGHVRSDIRWDDPHFRQGRYEKWTAYGQAKTANALFAVGFDNQFRAQGVRANAVMPGGIMTPLQHHLPMEDQRAMGWLDENDLPVTGFKSTEQGASGANRLAPSMQPGRDSAPG